MSFVNLNQINRFAGVQHTSLNCVICTDNFQEQDVAFAHDGTSVPHAFHLHCIEYWMNTSATCPSCRLLITHVNGQVVVTAQQGQMQETAEARAARVQELNAGAFIGDLERAAPALQGELTAAELGDAVYLAADGGYLDIVQAILPRGITEEKRGKAVITAARNNHYDVVTTLLQNGAISDAHRLLATQAASARGYETIVTLLQQGTQVQPSMRA